jgi:hypothetical protein
VSTCLTCVFACKSHNRSRYTFVTFEPTSQVCLQCRNIVATRMRASGWCYPKFRGSYNQYTRYTMFHCIAYNCELFIQIYMADLSTYTIFLVCLHAWKHVYMVCCDLRRPDGDWLSNGVNFTSVSESKDVPRICSINRVGVDMYYEILELVLFQMNSHICYMLSIINQKIDYVINIHKLILRMYSLYIIQTCIRFEANNYESINTHIS